MKNAIPWKPKGFDQSYLEGRLDPTSDFEVLLNHKKHHKMITKEFQQSRIEKIIQNAISRKPEE